MKVTIDEYKENMKSTLKEKIQEDKNKYKFSKDMCTNTKYKGGLLMNSYSIYQDIAKRTGGDIYIGVVGPVRTGKSTFIKNFMDLLVIPNIQNTYKRERARDELPQSAAGRTIMTTEPKFVPNEAVEITIGENLKLKTRLVDCVGYLVDGAVGHMEDDMPRMVKTPWFEEPVPFVEAAEIGTEKVIRDHATIGIVVTTDGSFGEIKRENYLDAEEKVIGELKEIGKPFILVLNTVHPTNTKTLELAETLRNSYNVPVVPISVENMNEIEIVNILKQALYEFPVIDIKVNMPEWIHVLPKDNEIKKHYLEKIKESTLSIEKVKDVENIIIHFENSEYIDKAYISELDASTGVVTLNLSSNETLYEETLKSYVGESSTTKAGLLKIFANYKENAIELDSVKSALKMARNTGYGIVYPGIKDMKLETPEIVKQGSRYGVKLKAVASSIHMMKVEVQSTFEPIIGSELQSKELINYLMKDYENDPDSIWKSEIFGRSLEEIVQEGIQAKLSLMPENTRYKLSNTVTKLVNKGSNNLIAIVL